MSEPMPDPARRVELVAMLIDDGDTEEEAADLADKILALLDRPAPATVITAGQFAVFENGATQHPAESAMRELMKSMAKDFLDKCNEIDRLKRGDFTPEEFQNLCHHRDEKPGCTEAEFKGGCRQYWAKLFGEKTLPTKSIGQELVEGLTEFADDLEAGDISKYKTTKAVRDPDTGEVSHAVAKPPSTPAPEPAMPDGSINPNDADDGWNYVGDPPTEGDCRKIVTLADGGLIWVGIRAFNHAERKWMNDNEPEKARVVAWRDLPTPAAGFWSRGLFYLPGAGARHA